MPPELQEALQVSANVTPLIQKRIARMILEYTHRYSPLIAAVPADKINSTAYYFNRRTAVANTSFVQDNGQGAPVTSSTFEQAVYQVRNVQTVGGVTGYSELVTQAQIGSLKREEMEGAIQGQMWGIENAMMWGSANATLGGPNPQFAGLDTLVSQFSNGVGSLAYTNAIAMNGSLSLHMLNQLIAQVQKNLKRPVTGGEWMFVMSPGMSGTIDELLTNQQRFEKVEVAAGLLVKTYKNIPIVETSFLSSEGMGMGAVSSTASTTGGSITAGTRIYAVSAVLSNFGEIAVSATTSVTTTGTTSSVTLTITPPAAYENGGAILYKVYEGATSSTLSLLGKVAAVDTTGAAVTTVIDTGSNLLTNSLANTGTTGYADQNSGQLMTAVGSENIYLIPRIKDFVLRPYVRDFKVLPLFPTTAQPDVLPFAVLSDTCFAVRGPKYMARGSGVVSSL